MIPRKKTPNRFDIGFDIQSDDELSVLLNKLSQDLGDAHVYQSIKQGLQNSIFTHDRVFSQSNTFWAFSLRAFQTGSMLTLCRAFDQSHGNLSLRNFLCVIAKNAECLSNERFRKRNSGNHFVEILLQDRTIPQLEEIIDDIDSVSESNALVKKLVVWRNNIIAHTGGNSLLASFKALDNNPMSMDEFSQLVDLGFEKLNKYSNLLSGSSFSKNVIQQEDYKWLLQAAKEKLDVISKESDKEFANLMYSLSGTSYEI